MKKSKGSKTSNKRSHSSASAKTTRSKVASKTSLRKRNSKQKNYEREEKEGKPRFIDDRVVGKKFPQPARQKKSRHVEEDDKWAPSNLEEVEDFNDNDEDEWDE